MSTESTDADAARTRHRAFCYITHQDHIVLIGHVDHPQRPLQIPGGTIECGEDPAAAACREAFEETGLQSLKLVRLLGQDVVDMKNHGYHEIIHGWFYQFSTNGFELGDSWFHDEVHAHGGGGPIKYELKWHPINNLPETYGRDARFVRVI